MISMQPTGNCSEYSHFATPPEPRLHTFTLKCPEVFLWPWAMLFRFEMVNPEKRLNRPTGAMAAKPFQQGRCPSPKQTRGMAVHLFGLGPSHHKPFTFLDGAPRKSPTNCRYTYFGLLGTANKQQQPDPVFVSMRCGHCCYEEWSLRVRSKSLANALQNLGHVFPFKKSARSPRNPPIRFRPRR